jgi:histidine triad (HIT) family protein
MSTIFDKIISREIPADIVYEDEEILAFKDIAPKAPVHYLIIPKQPIATLNDANPEDKAQEAGVAEGGYRVQMNCNPDGGQVVYHIHLHVMGGRAFSA